MIVLSTTYRWVKNMRFAFIQVQCILLSQINLPLIYIMYSIG